LLHDQERPGAVPASTADAASVSDSVAALRRTGTMPRSQSFTWSGEVPSGAAAGSGTGT